MPIHRLSDSRLVRRSQQGDRDAFLALLQRYDHRLRGLAYALVTGEAAMERVLRTAYLRAWREVVRADADDDAGTWLYRMTYNACIDELRRERARLDGPDGGGDAEPEADDPLAAALAALTPEQRLAVVLVDREGFPLEGAARISGVGPEQFAERLAEARAGLGAALPTAAPRRRNAPGRPGTRPGAPRHLRPPAPKPSPDAGPAAEPGPAGVAPGVAPATVAAEPDDGDRSGSVPG